MREKREEVVEAKKLSVRGARGRSGGGMLSVFRVFVEVR